MKISLIYNADNSILPYSSLFPCLFIFFISGQLCAQNETHEFQAEIVLGMNFSQLDGDGLSGFNKLGLRSGFRLSRAISESKGIAMSLLFDQRGSNTGILSGRGSDQFISLDYISIPLTIYFNNWWHEPFRRHKLRIMGTITPSRLIASRSSHRDFDHSLENFKKWDVALGIGISYSVGFRGAVNISIERSITKIYKPLMLDKSALQSYLVHVGFGYTLNQLQ